MKTLLVFALLACGAFAEDLPVSTKPQPVTVTDVKVPDDLKVTYFRLRAALEHVVGQIALSCKDRDLTVIKNQAGEEQDLVCHTPSPAPVLTPAPTKENK